MAIWKLEDAKARFSDLVRRAHTEGPQTVTVRERRLGDLHDGASSDRSD
jgi:prevent-host-death family protein